MLNAPDNFGSLLALGVTSWIAYQSIINFGGITRSMPLTGIPLPFLSYGGSALAATMAGFGFLLSVSRDSMVYATAREMRPVAKRARRRLKEESA